MTDTYDPWDAALREAYAAKPPEAIIIHTLEFRHPEFKEEGVTTPIYVVAQPQDMDLPLVEGEDPVTFLRCAFRFEIGKQDGREPSSDVYVDNVTKFLTPHLEAAIKVRATLYCTYRQYISTDLSGPKFQVSDLEIRNVSTTATSVKGTARLASVHNKKFPELVYELNKYPGLTR